MNFSPINWNHIEDDIDLQVWDRLNQNLWLDGKMVISKDIESSKRLTSDQRLAVLRAFSGLTTLDTLQSREGALALIRDAQTDHEAAVLTNIAYMESVHAKSYSSVFATLYTSTEIKETNEWARTHPLLQKKIETVRRYYHGHDPHMKKVASVFLESFLFYSGFYLPLKLAANQMLTATCDLIKLIIRDEALHGYYIGYKFQRGVARLSEAEQLRVKESAYDLLLELYEIEVAYTNEIYARIGWASDVKTFLHYNANKALMNLGYDALFPADLCKADPAVLASLSGGVNHDFFSKTGSDYVMGKVEATSDEDWEF